MFTMMTVYYDKVTLWSLDISISLELVFVISDRLSVVCKKMKAKSRASISRNAKFPEVEVREFLSLFSQFVSNKNVKFPRKKDVENSSEETARTASIYSDLSSCEFRNLNFSKCQEV